jgi:GTP-binding protein
VVLLDVRREPDERDRRLLEWLRHYGVPSCVVVTKTDKVTRQQAITAQRDITTRLGLPTAPLLTSAKSGQGIPELRALLARVVRPEQDPGSRG